MQSEVKNHGESRHNDQFPRRVWCVAAGGTLLVIGVVGAVAVALGLGAADPPVAGPVVWRDDVFEWAAGIPSAAGMWWTAPEPVPGGTGVFTLTVSARLLPDRDPLAAWGVWVAGVDRTRLLYALNASGYWTIRACAPGATSAIEDCPAPDPDWRWRAFPRIHLAGETNVITLHREVNGALRLRINDERLGAPAVLTAGDWGLWARAETGDPIVEWGGASLALAQ